MIKGKIITFYSYKGGVGRTMSLANIAVILAQWGYKVLVIDWDLEAPGLERYFMNYSSIKLDKKLGVIDLLLDNTSKKKVYWNRYLHDIKISKKYSLKFLGSGKNESDYYEKLKKLDIDTLYEKNSGFELFERIRSEWKSKFDFVLIDSRTGITDNGGICTIQLPDIVFVFTNTNEQSVLGTKEIIKRINISQQSQPYDRQNLLIFPILCRFDTTTEFEISQFWIKKVADTLKNVFNDWLPLKVDLKEFIEKTKIPYFPFFSFGEKLSVLEQGYSDPSSMGYAYESLASLIVNKFENIESFITNRSNYINYAKRTFELSSIFKIIGVGGGGSNAVTHMYQEGIQGVDFILCNTDAQSLNSSPVINKIHIGKRVLGAGNMPSVGRDAAIETKDEIRDMLQQHTKMLFITAGMGGGTGTGAAPIIAEIARELDVLTVGIVTLPFSFEGKKRQQQALEGIIKLHKSVDTLLIISNDKLREEYGNMKLTEAFRMADNVLTIAANSIAEIFTVTGYNDDFENVKTVIQDSGIALMGLAVAEGKNRANRAVEEALSSPLLNNNRIKGADNILLYIASGNEEITMDEVTEITSHIQNEAGQSAEIICGIGENESLENKIRLTIIATGFKENGKGVLESFMKHPTESVYIHKDDSGTEVIKSLVKMGVRLKASSDLIENEEEPANIIKSIKPTDKKNEAYGNERSKLKSTQKKK